MINMQNAAPWGGFCVSNPQFNLKYPSAAQNARQIPHARAQIQTRSGQNQHKTEYQTPKTTPPNLNSQLTLPARKTNHAQDGSGKNSG